jgi:hypothetical protein
LARSLDCRRARRRAGSEGKISVEITEKQEVLIYDKYGVGQRKMGRSLIWVQGNVDAGWACSSCTWRFPVPTLLGEDAKDAYDRLAAAKFREHACEVQAGPAAPQANRGPTLADRARRLIKGGYKPKDAVEVVLQETALEHRNDPYVMAKAREDAEDFLLKVRKGLI